MRWVQLHIDPGERKPPACTTRTSRVLTRGRYAVTARPLIRSLARSFPIGAVVLALAMGFFADPASAGPTVQEIPIETAHGGPFGVAAGPGGTMWFTESYGDKIGVLDRRLHQREIRLVPGSSPE